MERDVTIAIRGHAVLLDGRNIAISNGNVGMVLRGEAQFLQIKNPFVSVDCLNDEGRSRAGRKGAPKRADHSGGVFSFEHAQEIETEEEGKSLRQTKVAPGERRIGYGLNDRK